jgi:diguanylate cyclase (GGDEF)-like protein
LVFDPKIVNAKLQKRQSSHSNHTGMTITEFSSVKLPESAPINSLNNASIALRHDDKGIKIRFSNMEFNGNTGQWFYYQLLNEGKIISEQKTREATIDIPYLEAGDYTFKVFEKDRISGENANGASLNINVAHAPWTSPFAFFAYSVIILSVFASLMLMRKRQLLALNAAKLQSSMFGEAFKQTRDCVVLLDANQRAFAANEAFLSVFGVSDETNLAEHWEKLLGKHRKLADSVSCQLRTLDSSSHTSRELHLSLAPNDVHDFLVKGSVVDGKHFGEASLFMLIFSDISEQKETQRKLTQMATHDTLTGLANRQLLMDRLEHAVKHCQEHNRQLAVMFIDLDRFKAINDSLGHNMGDALLTELSRRMRRNCPPDMTLARVGGDEFVAVAEDIENIESVTKFARQLIDIIEQPVIVSGETLRVSCSVGASIFPHDAMSPDVLLRFADMAMYSAKKDPITPFCFYTRTLNEAAHERLQMENLVKAAYDQKSFYNVYQPIVNVTRGNTVGFELLMRCDIEGVFLSPAEFIPVLEQLRLIVDVTKDAVANAIEELATWYAKGFNGYISVNLSALHFTDDIDIDFFLQCLNKHSLPKTALRFEVTENVLMNDKEQALEQFIRLKEADFKLALDDFGTGYSSLGYLRAFPLDVIKIDKSFCDGIEQSDRSNGLVETTINMSKSLRMGCIAEGVETKEQVAFLTAQGCYLHQGYYFSAPVNAHDAAKLALKDWL